MFSKIGQLTRKLHTTLRELGFDKSLEEAASAIPDARDRLNYIATLTEQAAERALNAVDAAMPLQDKIQDRSGDLAQQWQKLFDKQLSVEEFKTLVADTRKFLDDTQQHSKETSTQLLEIMMAQDFQDITGQLIKKVVAITKKVETELAQLLKDNAPADVREKIAQKEVSLMSGPSVPSEALNQDSVDDLLADLGF